MLSRGSDVAACGSSDAALLAMCCIKTAWGSFPGEQKGKGELGGTGAAAATR